MFLPDARCPYPGGWLVLLIGKGPGPLPKYLSGKGANNWPIRRGTSSTLILTKVGLRLPKALWCRRPGLHGDLLPTVGPVLVLLHRNGCLCLILSHALAPLCTKEEREALRGLAPAWHPWSSWLDRKSTRLNSSHMSIS